MRKPHLDFLALPSAGERFQFYRFYRSERIVIYFWLQKVFVQSAPEW